MPRLLIVNGEDAGRSCPLDGKLLIGRESSADLSLNDPAVSRRHVLLAAKAGGWSVIDLQTRNGTFVNGERIDGPTMLRDGDELSLGSVVLRYTDEDVTSRALRAWQSGRPPAVRGPATDEGAVKESHLRFVAQLAAEMGTLTLDDAFLSKVLSRLLELAGADRGLIGLRSTAGSGLVMRTARTRFGDLPWLRPSTAIVERVVEGGVAVVEGAPGESLLAVPVPDPSETHKASGLIQLESTDAHKPLGQCQLALAQAVGAVLGLAGPIDRGRQARLELGAMQSDLALGGEVQRAALFGSLPALDGLSFAVHWKPALGIGGDFYLFVSFSGAGLGIVVGDVSGKGVSAALCGARVVAEFRAQQRRASGPADLLARVNRALWGELPQGLFATAAVLSVGDEREDIVVANAGHPLPYLVGPGSSASPLGPSGDPALGVAENVTYRERTGAFSRHDLVAAYTDGVSDASNADGEQFGEERLVSALCDAPRNAGAALEAAVSRLEEFVGQAPAEDDILLACLSRRGENEGR